MLGHVLDEKIGADCYRHALASLPEILRSISAYIAKIK
jgi:hypothetical protein